MLNITTSLPYINCLIYVLVYLPKIHLPFFRLSILLYFVCMCISNGYGNQLLEHLSLLGANTYKLLVFNNLSILVEETLTFLFVLE